MDAFTALGLDDLQARVLAVVLAEDEVTAAALADETGASLPAISVAVKGLVRRGLVDRVYGRRPSVVFLAAGAEAAFGRLVAAVEDRERERRELTDEAARLLAEAALARRERGRPRYEMERYVRGEGHVRPSRRGRSRHDQVVSARDVLASLVGLSYRPCPARLLVTGTVTDADLAEIARRQQPGSQVRASTDRLPALWLLDDDRVGVVSATGEGGVIAWSRDAAHRAAAAELFALWWDRAGPEVVTPLPQRQPEPDWDDEWDPADLDGDADGDGPDGHLNE